jgi:hypothetical protein
MHIPHIPQKTTKTYNWHMRAFNSLPNLLMIKIQGNLKAHFIKTLSQVMKQVKSKRKLNAHVVNQSGEKPMIEGRLVRNMQENASVTFYFTCTSSHNH